MGNDRSMRVAQQTKMDQFTAPSASGGLQSAEGEAQRGTIKPSGAQTLVAIEASGLVLQAKIEAIALDANLLRTDLCKVAERSLETESQVTEMQEDVSHLKATVMALETHSSKMEAWLEDAEGRSYRCNLRFLGFPEGAEGSKPEVFLDKWIVKALLSANLSTFLTLESMRRS
ncbi:hypothetical protein NDU88_003127 [Pleurodeles waltl]|uniref:Uncharacterized protein n=1 Tax=Pleurodeles waltl TaxID=8319 RepID=A0AAV7W5A5_PLEWA|nr:hypothetical protein NDU88_003127 [Pleurodeles waltl]